MNSYFSSFLELLGQTHVPVTVTDRVERRIVVVVERTDNRRRLAVERVVNTDREAGAPEHTLPDRGRSGFGDRRALAVLGFLHVRSGFRRRLDELVAQLHVERDVARHVTGFVTSDRVERRVVAEVANVVTRRDEVEMSPFPLAAEEALVPRNRTRSQRQGAVVVVAQEADERSRARLRLPRKEVVVTTGERELAPTLGRQFVNRREIHTRNVAFARVAESGVDTIHAARRGPRDAQSWATTTSNQAATIRVNDAGGEQHLRERISIEDQVR